MIFYISVVCKNLGSKSYVRFEFMISVLEN